MIIQNFFVIQFRRFSTQNQAKYFYTILLFLKNDYIYNYFIINTVFNSYKVLLTPKTPPEILNIVLKIFYVMLKAQENELYLESDTTLISSFCNLIISPEIGNSKFSLLLCFYAFFNRPTSAIGYRALLTVLKYNKDLALNLISAKTNPIYVIVSCINYYYLALLIKTISRYITPDNPYTYFLSSNSFILSLLNSKFNYVVNYTLDVY